MGSEEDSNKLATVAVSLKNQEEEIIGLKDDLEKTKSSFEAFQRDYSSLLTLYNETNDQLQDLLRARHVDPPPPPSSNVDILTKQVQFLEQERDKYKELYDNSKSLGSEPRLDDESELQDQVQYLAQQVQELQEHREILIDKVAVTSAKNDQLMQELAYMTVSQEQVEKDTAENQATMAMLQRQLDVKNSVIEKLKEEYTQLGEDKERLEAVITRTEESKENQLQLLDTANINKDDLNKEFQVLQYRCCETERREQEAVAYIKNCLKLVEQTQHEKEQLIIQCKQSETLRLEIEETLSSLIDEASRRTHEEVESIRRESNNKLSSLLRESASYQEQMAEQEATIENIIRERDLLISCQGNKVDAVFVADKEAVIYKLKERIFSLEQDKVNLTDQLMELTNTMKLSKEHFESRIGSATSQLNNYQDKLKLLVEDNSALYQQLGINDAEVDLCRNKEKTLRSKVSELNGKLVNTQVYWEGQLNEIKLEEERKREMLKEGMDKTISNLRDTLQDKQNEVLQQQELNTNSLHNVNYKEAEYSSAINKLNKKYKDLQTKHKQNKQQLITTNEMYKRETESKVKIEARLRAVNMQLNSANNQIAVVTENEAKLCLTQKELQLKLDTLTYDLQRRSGGGSECSLGLDSYILPPSVTKVRGSAKDYRKKDRKQERWEKEEINKIFSSHIRSENKSREKREKRATSTPITDKSDVTVKRNQSDVIKEFMTDTDSDVSFR